MRPFEDHVHALAYCAYVKSACLREGLPCIMAERNSWDKDFWFGVIVKCAAPWDQYNRNCRPGTWLRTIRQGETVHDVIAAYRRAYSAETSR